MAEDLGLPREKIDVVYPGITLKGYRSPQAPASGRSPSATSHASVPKRGCTCWLTPSSRCGDVGCRTGRFDSAWPAITARRNRDYLRQQEAKLNGFGGDYAHVDCPSHLDKQKFLGELDVLSVPTVYREPKGLYVLEAWASGVPVVQPRHGSFPELVERTGGGMLVEPGDVAGHAAALEHLARNPDERRAMGARGRAGVERHFHDGAMAETTERIFARLSRRISGLDGEPSGVSRRFVAG